MENRRIIVCGLGYVGCVTAAGFAKIGHSVVGIDIDKIRVSTINSGLAPFYEPDLDDLISSCVRTGRLVAAVRLPDVILKPSTVFICVGTPTEASGRQDLSQLRRICCDILQALDRHQPLMVVIRSTVLPGTCERLVASIFAGCRNVTVISNPEFLREGMAISDFFNPSLLVIGAQDARNAQQVADLYGPLGHRARIVSLRSAETIKYACNAFHAVKIVFANEIGAFCSRLGVSPNEVMATLCCDERLNTSAAYLKPGFAFGGSCLGKDLSALINEGLRLNVRLPMLASVLPSNCEHIERALDRLLEVPAVRMGVFGLAFKENTSDFRESPIVVLIKRLLEEARDVRIYDPCCSCEQIPDSMRGCILDTISDIRQYVVTDLEEVLKWADHLVIAQRPDSVVAQLLMESGLPFTDLVNALPDVDKCGFITTAPPTDMGE